MEEVPVFKSAKRRKLTRTRMETSPDSAPQSASNNNNGSARANASNEDDHEDDAVISKLIGARKNVRRPATGVHFSTTKAAPEEDSSQAPVRLDESDEKPLDMTNRFIGSTGQVVNVDKHMVAFIDSELARRRNAPIPGTHDSQRSNAGSQHDATSSHDAGASNQQKGTANPAAARQLAEVELGHSAHDFNLARTQAALERIKAGQAPIEDEVKPPKPRKPRLGRDGKPMKPRPRKGRNSEDIARDTLVEQFLHENKIDLYETSTPEPASAKGLEEGGGEDADADERFAEQFRQEFLDAMAERRNKTKPVPQAKGVAVPEPRGPKLGGSRSARAKMAQIQQQQQPSSSKI
ncbi:hypothetical protein H2200_008288 [Cladophialophora chaetospira]|uniref:Uncharacterized protein n=1 Tax=Cladophialophora chaetospira TaxID=386627 RepID=A0AA38X5M1_9EURO|nr:hypothetical protein H2200_008288 [Cladophialophora chaetospira]